MKILIGKKYVIYFKQFSDSIKTLNIFQSWFSRYYHNIAWLEVAGITKKRRKK
tara:strand:+ start:1046 stop:1204 length:159 start_codon:yes stop_codon:yes gene_type:complete